MIGIEADVAALEAQLQSHGIDVASLLRMASSDALSPALTGVISPRAIIAS